MAKSKLDSLPLSDEEISDIKEARDSDDFESRTLEQLLAELNES